MTLLTENLTPDFHLYPSNCIQQCKSSYIRVLCAAQMCCFEENKQILGQISVFCKYCADM